MLITCPHCGFKKEIATEQIPDNIVRVTCPTCRQPFPLARLAETVSEEVTGGIAPEDGTVTEHADETNASETTEQTETTDKALAEAIEPSDSELANNELTESVEPTYSEQVEPASIGARYAALLIDTMLVMIMVLILRAGITLLGNGIGLEGQIMLGVIFMLFALTLGFAYHTLFIGICGQTPGKMLLRIRVVVADNSHMTYRRAMLREVLGKTLSLPLLLGYLMAMFNPRHLAAHDKIADTCVVKLIPEATVD